MRLRPADLAAFAEFNAGTAAARAEYRRFPHVGNFSDYRAPCQSCTTPTYSKHGVCRFCSKGDT